MSVKQQESFHKIKINWKKTPYGLSGNINGSGICHIYIVMTLDLSDERKTWAEFPSEVQEVLCIACSFTGTQRNRVVNNWL